MLDGSSSLMRSDEPLELILRGRAPLPQLSEAEARNALSRHHYNMQSAGVANATLANATQRVANATQRNVNQEEVRVPPRRKKLAENIDWENRTTVMIRNIPSSYTQRKLLEELDARGWKGTYDFFYLPFDFERGHNAGYCFMNFKDPSFAEACHGALNGEHLGEEIRIKLRKRLQVVPAVTQGYQENLEHFRHSAVLNHHGMEHGPIFLRPDFPTYLESVPPLLGPQEISGCRRTLSSFLAAQRPHSLTLQSYEQSLTLQSPPGEV